MTLHAGTDLESPFGAIGIRGPAFGQIRLDEIRAGLSGLHPHQTIKNIIQQTFVGCRRRQMRIKLACIGRSHPDDQRLFLCMGLIGPETRRKASCNHQTQNHMFFHSLIPLASIKPEKR